MNIFEKIDAGVYENRLAPLTKEASLDEQDAYYKESGRLGRVFRVDALEEACLTGHPLADKAFNFAAMDRYGSGRRAIVKFLCELAADVLL